MFHDLIIMHTSNLRLHNSTECKRGAGRIPSRGNMLQLYNYWVHADEELNDNIEWSRMV